MPFAAKMYAVANTSMPGGMHEQHQLEEKVEAVD